jgi:hypothetical protein
MRHLDGSEREKGEIFVCAIEGFIVVLGMYSIIRDFWRCQSLVSATINGRRPTTVRCQRRAGHDGEHAYTASIFDWKPIRKVPISWSDVDEGGR